MKTWIRRTLITLGAVTLFQVIVSVVFHRKNPVIIDTIREFNRRYLNPAMLHLAGRRLWYASSIHHRGRSSGRSYETQVWAHMTDDGFVIPLAYGTDVDWVMNLQAAGGGALLYHGDIYRVTAPKVIPRDVAFGSLAGRERLRYGFYGVDEFLHLEADDAVVHPLHGTG